MGLKFKPMTLDEIARVFERLDRQRHRRRRKPLPPEPAKPPGRAYFAHSDGSMRTYPEQIVDDR